MTCCKLLKKCEETTNQGLSEALNRDKHCPRVVVREVLFEPECKKECDECQDEK